MEEFTPVVTNFVIEPVDASSIAVDLFKNATFTPVVKVNTKNENEEKLTSFLRIRPIENCDSSNPDSTFYKISDTKLEAKAPLCSQTFKNSKGNLKETKKRIFEFNRILNERVDQRTLYETCVEPLVDNFFKGENALLFAYGTTSSGKTFTIRGNNQDPGIIPRCISAVFEKINTLDVPLIKRAKFNEFVSLDTNEMEKELGIKNFILNYIDERVDKASTSLGSIKSYNSISNNSSVPSLDKMSICNPRIKQICWISFVELYNESLVDLLAIDVQDEKLQTLKLMRDFKNNFFVSGLRHVFAESAEEAYKILLFGLDNLKKHVSSTAMNKNSSRSHAIFTISIISLQELQDSTFKVLHVNNLSLCDLAGLERGKKTGNTGVRMKEAGQINKSLFSLNRCISLLRQNQKSTGQPMLIPYTDSNLTKIFQPFLCGFGITSMIININPLPEHYDETIASLEFSATASEVVICKDESRSLVTDKLKRVTQMWLLSTKRWSTFAQTKRKSSISNLSIPASINESETSYETEIEESEFEETFREATEITENLLKATEALEENDLRDEEEYKEYINKLLEKLEQLEEKLRDSEDEKALIDIKARAQVGEQLFKVTEELTKKYEEEKDRARRRMEILMQNRLELLTNEHTYRENKFKQEIEQLKDEIYNHNEKLLELNDQLEKNKAQSSIEIKNLREEYNKTLNEINAQKQILEIKEKEWAKIEKSLKSQLTEKDCGQVLKSVINEVEKDIYIDELENKLNDVKKELNFLKNRLQIPCCNVSTETTIIEQKDCGTNISFIEPVKSFSDKNMVTDQITKIDNYNYADFVNKNDANTSQMLINLDCSLSYNDKFQKDTSMQTSLSMVRENLIDKNDSPSKQDQQMQTSLNELYKNVSLISENIQTSLIDFDKNISVTLDDTQNRTQNKANFSKEISKTSNTFEIQTSLLDTTVPSIEHSDFLTSLKESSEKNKLTVCSADESSEKKEEKVNLLVDKNTSCISLDNEDAKLIEKTQQLEQTVENLNEKIKNFENELTKIKRKKRELEALLEMKEDTILSLTSENQNLKKEVLEFKNGVKNVVNPAENSVLDIVKSAVSAVKNKNNTQNNMSVINESLLKSTIQKSERKDRKKRSHEEDLNNEFVQNYLNFVKLTSPKDKKNKKKKMDELEEEMSENEDVDDKDKDDIGFFVESERKPKRGRKKKSECATSTRKRIPLKESHRDSIILENAALINPAVNMETRSLRARKKIVYN